MYGTSPTCISMVQRTIPTPSATSPYQNHTLIAVWNPTTITADHLEIRASSVSNKTPGTYVVFPYQQNLTPRGYVTVY
jgi:hypothetical protein